MNKDNFWQGKKVLLTGHTGFKGSWLSLMLQRFGAEVAGYSLAPQTEDNMFSIASVADGMTSVFSDIRDIANFKAFSEDFNPEIVIHMAAQPLVRESYVDPITTYETNVMGTVNILQTVRELQDVKACVVITTDKCYENKEWHWGYRENEPLGGYDPYSSSKACTELVASSFRNSYFSGGQSKVSLATARAGNVIGGGDWADDRLLPDVFRSIASGSEMVIRYPHAIRPWQHVLEPLTGYLNLAQKLYLQGDEFAEAWNFGPADKDAKPVSWIMECVSGLWGDEFRWCIDSDGNHPHEAHYLKLDCSKAKEKLKWLPMLGLEEGLKLTVDWFKAYQQGSDMKEFTFDQIDRYLNLV